MSAKFELFGLLATDPDLDLRKYVQKYGEPLNTLKTWKREFKKSKTAEDLDKLLNVDAEIVERVANEVVMEIDHVAGEIVSAEVLEGREAERAHALEVKEKYAKIRAETFTSGASGLNALRGEVQATAADLVHLIAQKIELEGDELSIKDMNMLSSSISTIQNSFFNRPTTNIQVNNVAGEEGGTSLSAFREQLRA